MEILRVFGGVVREGYSRREGNAKEGKLFLEKRCSLPWGKKRHKDISGKNSLFAGKGGYRENASSSLRSD